MKKKNFLMMASVSLLAAAATLCACDKDENENGGDASPISGNTITITVEDGASYADQVDEVRLTGISDDDYIASSSYTNGSFTINLPASVDDKHLSSVSLYFGIAGISASAKMNDAHLYAYKSGKQVGRIYHGTQEWDGMLEYANEDVNITGSSNKSTYSCNLKKGWNMWYVKRMETSREYATKAPSGAKWIYEP
ncbi:MAG: hypothetical protein LBJ57_04610 [Prevotellaceae bacterium]|nr:hypothetical protein [Prevotellaceae bacterium]